MNASLRIREGALNRSGLYRRRDETANGTAMEAKRERGERETSQCNIQGDVGAVGPP